MFITQLLIVCDNTVVLRLRLVNLLIRVHIVLANIFIYRVDSVWCTNYPALFGISVAPCISLFWHNCGADTWWLVVIIRLANSVCMCSMDPATLVSKFPRSILWFHLLHLQLTFCVLVELITGAFSHLFPYMLFFTDPEMMNTVELSLDTSIESFTEKHKVSSSQCLIDSSELYSACL